MTNPSGRKRSAISTLLAVIVVAASLVVLGVMRVTSLFRQKYVPIEQLKFPVLVFQPDGMWVFAEWDDVALQKFPERSLRTPADGTVIVDSEFNQFTQENVHRQKEGDLKWFARFLVPQMRIKYTFDLRRRKESGREAMMEMIRHAPPFSDDPAEDASLRSTVQHQSTMAGVLDALRFYKPVEPTTLPTPVPDTQPTTEPDPSNAVSSEPEPGRDGDVKP